MKIKQTAITVSKRPAASAHADAVVAAAPKAGEHRVRQYYRSALRAAAAKKRASIVFVVDDTGLEQNELLAAAKILAQEIYRLLHQGTHALRTVIVCATGSRAYAACTKNTLGYMDYIENKLKSPFLTVDAIIEYKGGIVLIERTNPPFGWAIPGGFVDYGESLEDAVIREAKEETGLALSGLRQLHTYSDPARDPRFHTVTTVFSAKGTGTPAAGDDAGDIRVAYPHDLKKIHFAFNHRDVLLDYLSFKAGKNPY